MNKKNKLNYSEEDLECLRKIFYDFSDYSMNQNEINKGLNLFYGFDPDEKPTWKKAFKEVIKKKVGEKLLNISSKELSEIDAAVIISNAFIKKSYIIEKTNKLNWIPLKNEKTIIYEAPPYLLIREEENGMFNYNFVAEFILDDNCTSPYSSAIRSCFDNKKSPIIEILNDNNCGFFDVIPMPLPINSNLRNEWATDDKFLIQNKRIFVHFFEWALDNYMKKIESINSTEKHKIALGIPLNNAISLYEYYCEIDLKFGDKEIGFNAAHSVQFKKKKLGLWIHSFKNCIISTSNTPNGELMKLAFDFNNDKLNE